MQTSDFNPAEFVATELHAVEIQVWLSKRARMIRAKAQTLLEELQDKLEKSEAGDEWHSPGEVFSCDGGFLLIVRCKKLTKSLPVILNHLERRELIGRVEIAVGDPTRLKARPLVPWDVDFARHFTATRSGNGSVGTAHRWRRRNNLEKPSGSSSLRCAISVCRWFVGSGGGASDR